MHFYIIYSSEIYKEFTATLDHLYHQSISNPLTPTIPSKPGPPLQTPSNAVVMPAKKIVCNVRFFLMFEMRL